METMSYPPELAGAESTLVMTAVKDWSVAHGLAIRPPPALVPTATDPQGALAMSAPVTLFPSLFPRSCFEQAKGVRQAYNLLYARISQDESFLREMVEEIQDVDEFIAQLWQVHLKVKAQGYTQSMSLGLFRSDYMIHCPSVDEVPEIKQVEFNTIANSFACLSTATSKMHKYLAHHVYPLLVNNPHITPLKLPENNSADLLASGLIKAHRAYIDDTKLLHSPCIIFITQLVERNVFDQRHLEYAVQELSLSSPGEPISVFRVPLANVLEHTTIADTSKRQLVYHPPSNPNVAYEVTVVYHRAGYDPVDYPDSSAWEARMQLERSHAIKCPSILTQLAGCKKVQQLLATPSPTGQTPLLSRFLATEHDEQGEDIAKLRETFTNIFPLDESPAGLAARRIALDGEACQTYVLKPQREGGGNNIYRGAIPGFLQGIPESQWKQYILMEIISPPRARNTILRHGQTEQGHVICELGIFGVCLWKSSQREVLVNEEAGYLLRTKADQSQEGGVAAGFGAVDSCLLV